MGGKDGTQYYQFSVWLGGITTACSLISIIVYVAVWGLPITDSLADILALIGGVLGLLAGQKQVRHSHACTPHAPQRMQLAAGSPPRASLQVSG